MTEPAPYYGTRTFVCERCRQEFTPTADEARALEELERQFDLAPENCSLRCANCQRDRAE